MRNFRELKVWQGAHVLVLSVYRASARFPVSERYGLTDQMRKCAVSVPANIAEGIGRGSDADTARFLQMALGSAEELDYYFLLTHDLGYLDQSQHVYLAGEVSAVKRMLNAFVQRLTAEG